jgi:hypothetical protein
MPEADHIPLAYESEVSASVLEAAVPRLVHAVAVIGLMIGAARLFYGGTEAWINASLTRQLGLTISEAVWLLAAVLNMLVGAGLIASCAGCLQRKGWGHTLFMLNEPMAVVLYLLSTMAALASLNTRTSPGEMTGEPWYVAGDLIGWLITALAYPILGLSILRQRVVRGWFRRGKPRVGLTQTEPLAVELSASAAEPPSRRPENP